MSRTAIYQILRQDALSSAPGSLGEIGLQSEHVYPASVDTPKGDVFLSVRFNVSDVGMGASKRTQVTIWAYDRDPDYLRIERMLKRVRELFEGMDSSKTPEGWITTIRWTGEGEDAYDDIYKASTRNSTFMMVDSGR